MGMDVLERIRTYRNERNWTEYQLAERSGLTQSTISSWYRKDMLPSITSLERICKAFNITLAQFFAENLSEWGILNKEQLNLIHEWNRLEKNQQEALLAFHKTL